LMAFPEKPVPSVEDIRQRMKDPNWRPATPLEAKMQELQMRVKEMASSKKMSPRELREGLSLLFEKHNFNPVEELILQSQRTDNEGLAVKINIFLSELLVPKLKSVEVSGSVDHTHTVVIRRYGPDGRIEDAPMKTLAPKDSPVTRMTKPVERAIDTEVVK
jgi:hypothetical protein